MSKKYTIGVDFGTLSGRAVLVEVDTGNETASAVKEYSYGVIDEHLPGSTSKLGSDWALQHPQDWIEVFEEAIPAVLKQSAVDASDVIGMVMPYRKSL